MLHHQLARLRREHSREQEAGWENDLDVSQEDMRIGGDGAKYGGAGRKSKRRTTSGTDPDWLFKVAVLGALSASGLWGTLAVLRANDKTRYGGRTVTWWLAAAAPCAWGGPMARTTRPPCRARAGPPSSWALPLWA